MTRDFVLVHEPGAGDRSPYRLKRSGGEEVACVNAFLDDLALRGFSPRTLRSYGYSLLDASRWAFACGKDLLSLREEDLRDYVRFQKSRRPTEVSTINHRLSVLSALSRYHHEKDLSNELPPGLFFPRARERRRFASQWRSFRLKDEKRVVRPLPSPEVRTFVESLRTWRDLSLVHLMLFSGLRSAEVIGLALEDLSLQNASVRVRGKGRKERVVPLPVQTVPFLSSYLELERPESPHRFVFLSLKGPRRGQPMTLPGLRSIFRHHRKRTALTEANPHRFRHTFGTRCIKAGMSLLVLKVILGHAHIDTTLRYVEVSDPDVASEFDRVARILSRDQRDGSS